MNKIILNKPILIKGKYFVYFDSDNKFVFSNKRTAQDFLVKVEKQIEQAELFITEELNFIEQIYRLYFLADQDFKFKYKLSNSVEYLNNRIHWMNSHRGSENYNTIVYISVISCLKELEESFINLEQKAAHRKDTITKRRCALKIDLLRLFTENFYKLGIKKQMDLTLKRQIG